VNQDRWSSARWWVVGLLLVAWALRLTPLVQNPLHPDEALYGTWGQLIARGRDPWLSHEPVYKPPLLPYTVAGFQSLLGNRPFTLRLPGVTAGVLTVALVGALAQVLYGDHTTTLVAVVGIALSPFAVILSGIAFPDPLMVLLGTASCVAAGRGRPGWAGALAGMSFGAKQTGLVWMPLTLLVSTFSRRPGRQQLQPVLAITGLAALIGGLVFGWDGIRVAKGAPGFWQLGVVGFGGLRLIWPHEIWPRLRDWLGLLRHLFASPALNALLLLGLPVLVGGSFRARRVTRYALAELWLVGFSVVYVLFHWLLSFPAWDRYLLPLVPVLAILLGRIVALVADAMPLPILRAGGPTIWVVLVVALMGVPAFEASAGRYPVGRELMAYQGIEEVVAFFDQLPEGSVVYHHWLGWHFRYGLFDGPVFLAYWPNPAWLARDVQAFGGREARYMAFPAWESSERVRRALDDVGYALQPALTTVREDGSTSFSVYAIRRPSQR
jgi:4-amino-4-deoxy-L-arabinose transferase-like glycosyltransferase